MKRLALISAMFVCILVVPSQADAAKSCGTFADTEDVEWEVAAAKMPCDLALDIGRRYIAHQISTDWASWHVNVKGYRCLAGATNPGYCQRWYRKGLWLFPPGSVPVKRLHVQPLSLYTEILYMKRALRSKYGDLWAGGLGREVECMKLGRLKAKCAASWGIGDSGYNVWARVRIKAGLRFDLATVKGKARRFNWYCFGTLKRPPGKCTNWQKFGPQKFREI